MANLTETPTYEAGIYRFETTDPVQGGPGGIDNLPTNQLANRTAWLKAQVEAILLDIAAIESGYATDAELATHTGNTSNPHAVTKAQVGLGSVLNYGVATQNEAEAGTADTKYMTPLRASQAITAAFTGGNRELSPSGFQRLPGGLIIQWGTASALNGNGVWTYPVAFPNSVFRVFSSQDATASGSGMYAVGASINDAAPLTSALIASALASGGDAVFLFAIGY